MIYKAASRETIVVSSTAIGFTTANLTVGGRKVAYARVQVQTKTVAGAVTGAIRVREEGDPVAVTTGQLFNPGDMFEVWGEGALSDFRMIRETSTDGRVEVVYYV